MHIDARFGTKIRPVGVEILEAKQSLDPVSYTHLTLPTVLRV